MQERHPGRLVDAAALRLDDAVLDLIRHAEPVPAADLVRGRARARPDRRSRGRRSTTGRPPANSIVTSSGSIATSGSQCATPMIGVDDLHRRLEQLEILRLVRRAEHVRVGRVRLVDGRRVRQAALEQPLAHLPAPAELFDERAVEPRLVDPQVLVDEQPVAVEALDVVALVGRAVAPDVDAVLGHRLHELRPGDGAAERRRVEVAPARGLDVEGAALQRGQPFARERLLAVDEHRVLGAEGERLRGHGGDVRLVVLAEVGRERVRDRAVLAHPGERAARVEPARERDPDPLADRQRAEDHARLLASRSQQAPQLGRELGGRDAVAAGDEDGVVAGDRAGDLVQVRRRRSRRRARRRSHAAS